MIISLALVTNPVQSNAFQEGFSSLVHFHGGLELIVVQEYSILDHLSTARLVFNQLATMGQRGKAGGGEVRVG